MRTSTVPVGSGRSMIQEVSTPAAARNSLISAPSLVAADGADDGGRDAEGAKVPGDVERSAADGAVVLEEVDQGLAEGKGDGRGSRHGIRVGWGIL